MKKSFCLEDADVDFSRYRALSRLDDRLSSL
jgi:hypothetical protein